MSYPGQPFSFQLKCFASVERVSTETTHLQHGSSKIDIWAVTNTQAPHKKVRNHFFVHEITSPRSNRYIFCLLYYREPTLRRVCWATVTNCAPVTSLMPRTLFAVGFTRWHSADRKLQVANRFKPQVDIQFVTDLGLIFENIRPGRGRGLITGG